jgi:hypothetical protein
MSVATLLNIGDPKVFSFEHAMDHRQWIGLMGPTLIDYTQTPAVPVGPAAVRPGGIVAGSPSYVGAIPGVSFIGVTVRHTGSAIPYFIDPQFNITRNKNDPMGRLNHQQSHRDAIFYPSVLAPFGVPYPQILSDLRMNKRQDRKWWTFVNHNSHYTINMETALGQAQGQYPYYYPFW